MAQASALGEGIGEGPTRAWDAAGREGASIASRGGS
jgi:hypothetical protein